MSTYAELTDEQKSRYRATRLAKAKADGICYKCCVRPATIGPRGRSTICDRCRDQAADYARRIKDKAWERERERRKHVRQVVFERMGNKCARCELTDTRVLDIHHVNGDGAEDRGGTTESWKIRMRIFRGGAIDHLQLLCANCHRIHHSHPDNW